MQNVFACLKKKPNPGPWQQKLTCYLIPKNTNTKIIPNTTKNKEKIKINKMPSHHKDVKENDGIKK